MAIALEQELEAEMVTALERGDEVAFVAARNKRQAYWDYRDGKVSLEQAKYRLGKMPVGSKVTAPKACLDWNGETE